MTALESQPIPHVRLYGLQHMPSPRAAFTQLNDSAVCKLGLVGEYVVDNRAEYRGFLRTKKGGMPVCIIDDWERK